MTDREPIHTACAEMIATLNQQYGWDLDEPARRRYEEELVPLLSDTRPEDLRQRVQWYHFDHQRVAALRDASRAGHQEAWEETHHRVTLTLKGNGFGDYSNGAIDFEDLVQIALADFSASLSRFRFGSQLATWLHVVALNSARRTLRGQKARRRTAVLVPLDHPSSEEIAIPSTDQPEALADYRLLLEVIAAILQNHGDGRRPRIFQLWALEDQRLADIGKIMGLSKSRVSTLLEESRILLREALHQRRWIDEDNRDADERQKTQE